MEALRATAEKRIADNEKDGGLVMKAIVRAKLVGTIADFDTPEYQPTDESEAEYIGYSAKSEERVNEQTK